MKHLSTSDRARAMAFAIVKHGNPSRQWTLADIANYQAVSKQTARKILKRMMSMRLAVITTSHYRSNVQMIFFRLNDLSWCGWLPESFQYANDLVIASMLERRMNEAICVLAHSKKGKKND